LTSGEQLSMDKLNKCERQYVNYKSQEPNNKGSE
jgi:hypothetical protein